MCSWVVPVLSSYLSVLTSSYPDHFLFLYRTNTVIWIAARSWVVPVLSSYLSALTSSYPDHFLFLYRTNTVIWIVARPMCHVSRVGSDQRLGEAGVPTARLCNVEGHEPAGGSCPAARPHTSASSAAPPAIEAGCDASVGRGGAMRGCRVWPTRAGKARPQRHARAAPAAHVRF